MSKRRVKGLEGGLALDWVDAVLILVVIYGLMAVEVWLFGNAEDPWLLEILGLPGLLLAPMVRRFTLGVPVRYVEESATTSGMFATLAIVFGVIIAGLGGFLVYARATDEPPQLEIPWHDEHAERWNAQMEQMLGDLEAVEVDPSALPEGVVVETIELGVEPKSREQLEAEARAEHAEAMEEFRARRTDKIFTGVKIAAAGLLLLLLGGWLDSRRLLEEPPGPKTSRGGEG